MLNYLLRRLVQSAVLLVLVTVIAFALMHLAPGGPLAVYTMTPTLRAEDIETLKRSLGLDQPL
ncbi:MAG: diguanylate cyclase, partial [Chloroflexota bacterium]